MAPLSRTLLLAGLALGSLGCEREPEPVPEPVPANPTEVAPAAPATTHAAMTRTTAATEPKPEPAALHLTAPPMRAPVDVGRYAATPPAPSPRIAQAWQFDSHIYRRPSARRSVIGLVRRNTRLAVTGWVPGEGCGRGWFALADGGFVCSGEGFNVAGNPARLAESLQVDPPAVADALPYRYAKVRTPAPLYFRLPTERELARGSRAPVRELAGGAHFVAMDRSFTVGDQRLHRTVRGFYVRERDLDPKPMPTMHGQLLSGPDALPLAFVHVDEASLLDPRSGTIRGTADKFARFSVAEVDDGDDRPRVIATDGFAVAADDVRVVTACERPEQVGPDDQWIHVDLDQQTLVAYEGDRPVLATLVSSGKEGFEPPLGLFRVHKKYTTVTMSGPDPDAGTYAVEQVPWTMYYWGSYALHGAYWHDTFGHVRSHGCTNIPPIDARWLFYWSTPSLPTGWHAKVGLRGPWVYFTHGTDRRPEPSARSGAP